MGKFTDWLFTVEIPEAQVDERYPESYDDDPKAPQIINNGPHGFAERFGEDAQTERMGLPGDDSPGRSWPGGEDQEESYERLTDTDEYEDRGALREDDEDDEDTDGDDGDDELMEDLNG